MTMVYVVATRWISGRNRHRCKAAISRYSGASFQERIYWLRVRIDFGREQADRARYDADGGGGESRSNPILCEPHHQGPGTDRE